MTPLRGFLEHWDDDRGFGFIFHIDYSKGVFIHISAFKPNINRRPIVGDMIIYELFIDTDGKRRAVNARIEGLSQPKSKNSPKKSVPNQKNSYRKQNKSKSLSSSILALVFIGIAVFAISKHQVTETATKTATAIDAPIYTPMAEKEQPTTPQARYSCQGKTYCSQMTSCEEALFYQNNCSGTKMDGDGDGRPCEDWCGY